MNKLKKVFDHLRYYYLTFKILKFDSKSINNNDECIIVGNGPSLCRDLSKGFDFFKNKNIICVNNFVESEYYEEIKPNFYVIADPFYWEDKYEFFYRNNESDAIKSRGNYFNALKDIRISFIKNIVEKTKWELNLFIPIQSKSSKFFENIARTNFNINILYYSTIPINIKNTFIRHFLYRLNIGMPTPQNVLIAAIFLALKCKFKYIYLMGADHSWHEDLVLDENNLLGTLDRHFYDNSKERKIIPLLRNIVSGETTKVHEQFYALFLVFRSHLFLEKYSQSLKAKIYNLSQKTWIDAYSRKIGQSEN